MIVKRVSNNKSWEININHIISIEYELDQNKRPQLNVQMINGDNHIFLDQEATSMYNYWKNNIVPILGGYIN